MNRSLAWLLQVLIVLIGLGILGFLLWEPHLEGRNVHATLFEIYFKDPFLAYVYLGSVPFFVALYRAFALCGDVRRNGVFSPDTLNALAVIKRCASVLIGFVVGGVIFILLFGDKEDRPAGIFMCGLVAAAAGIIAIAARMFAQNLRNTIGVAEEP